MLARLALSEQDGAFPLFDVRVIQLLIAAAPALAIFKVRHPGKYQVPNRLFDPPALAKSVDIIESGTLARAEYRKKMESGSGDNLRGDMVSGANWMPIKKQVCQQPNGQLALRERSRIDRCRNDTQVEVWFHVEKEIARHYLDLVRQAQRRYYLAYGQTVCGRDIQALDSGVLLK